MKKAMMLTLALWMACGAAPADTQTLALEAARQRMQTVFGMPAVYLAHMARMDQAQIAIESGKPFLFLWGEADFQVNRAAFEAWRERLGGDGRFAHITYPGLNYLLMPADGEDSILNAQAAYAKPKQVDGSVIADIAAWIYSN